MITAEYSNSKTLNAMTFVPAHEPITVQAGNENVTMFFTPQIYVKTVEGTRTFSSRVQADIYFAAQVRRVRFWAGFDAYCRGLSLFDLHDPDEQRGYWAANSAQAETEERHDEFVEQEYIRRGW